MGRKEGNPIHGMRSTPTYQSWAGMKSRCSNKNHIHYKDYGGRGITFCDRWNDFKNFFEDMGIRPEGKTLDRIDNDKGYSKENCRWVAPNINIANTRAKNKSGIKGVYKEAKKYVVRMTINKKSIVVGYFDCPIIASVAFQNKHKEVYGF